LSLFFGFFSLSLRFAIFSKIFVRFASLSLFDFARNLHACSQQLDYILDDVGVKISAKTGFAIRNLFAVSGEKIKEGKINPC
jgi:hypothetical protein